MSQGLALAGSRGLYILEQLAINPEYETQFASFLTCINKLLGKGFVVPIEGGPESDDDDDDKEEDEEDHFGKHMDTVKKQLVETCATLESMMPMQWNTITRNLLLDMPDAMKNWGENWVTGLFNVERLHILVKSMCASKKSHMIGFMNNYKVWTTNQISWRFVTKYANKPRPSSLTVKVPLENIPKVSIPGILSLCFKSTFVFV